MGRWLVLCLLLLLALAACGGGADTTQPPEILYGQDVCDECDMIISEEKYAAAYWTAEGEARRFDDVGEMLVFMADNREPTASVWVHDINSAEWLLAEEAWFVMNSGLRTPMGTGIAVTADVSLWIDKAPPGRSSGTSMRTGAGSESVMIPP